ncbi:MAG: protein kinase [Gemmatimonadales bacterium]|nr:protein kinase [Gemmatimonadales bacterium]NIN49104.1 protein kinase [Gemmatimonadales bacterium]NIP06568.1 protein kinase [Gemmatimonadales bacterium]NIR00265.1 protein kinase [Gemmatimonadales bacterium]NIS64598.1 protein kinase [Gemmatimonadales bacterium]
MTDYPDSQGRANGEQIPPVMEAGVRRDLDRDYRIERVLGRGGMSIVYLAREIELNRLVALKVLPLQLAMGPDAADRFKREAKIAASLDHPHIVPIYRVGATQSFLWYSMKWVKGVSLKDILADTGPMELKDILRILDPVASALHHAHRRGIVHRDVKPENVLIDEAGWVTVCDFGIAKAFGTVPLTQTGGTLGTPGYMSTEQCYGQTLDGRSDQYSLAIVAYECLTGSLPFTADSLGEIVRKHCLEPPPRVTEARRGLPESVADALVRAMSKQPSERFDSVLQFVEALGGTPSQPVPAFAASSSVSKALAAAPTERVGSPTLPTPARWATALAAIALIAGIFIVTWITRPQATPEDAASAAEMQEGTAPSGEPGVAPGTLSVSSRPWGYVYVDDSLVGTTPRMGIRLAPGRHQLRIAREGYEPFEQVVEIASGQEVRLSQVVLRRSDTP